MTSIELRACTVRVRLQDICPQSHYCSLKSLTALHQPRELHVVQAQGSPADSFFTTASHGQGLAPVLWLRLQR